jgi:hypothetical protein
MTSFARRSIRTTAAAAGIAALGVGFAGHAFAAPALPELPLPDGLDAPSLPVAPDTSALPNVLGELPNPSSDLPAGDLADLPPVFTFEGPTVYTASDMAELPTDSLPGVPALSDLPGTGALSVPSLPEAGLPELPELPEAGVPSLATAGLPELGALPELPATDGLPSLPEVATPDLGSDIASLGGLTSNNNVGF